MKPFHLRNRKEYPQAGLLYHGETLSLATMHSKEKALALPFKVGLGAHLESTTDIDTDALGTFSGEIERQFGPKETVMTKARIGMAETRLPFGIATEGSFGPYPQLPWIQAHEEWIAFVDQERGILLWESLLELNTNFSREVCSDLDQAMDFAGRVGFPTHGLMVYPDGPNGLAQIRKGLRNRENLEEAIERAFLQSRTSAVVLETDMRADQNPTRMRVIRKLGVRLVRRLLTHCPDCDAPGFGMVDVEVGLPCELCGLPTDLVDQEVFGCAVCAYQERRGRRDRRTSASAQSCGNCNP